MKAVLVARVSSTGHARDQYWLLSSTSTGSISDQYWFANHPAELPPFPPIIEGAARRISRRAEPTKNRKRVTREPKLSKSHA